MTRAEGQTFKARWEAVNAAELEELRATSAEEKLRQLAALMASARQMGWTEALAAEEEEVRERWIRLRRAYGIGPVGQNERQVMTREFTVVIERDEDGYLVASVPSLHGCHTQARSMDELLERIKEAIQLCLDVQEGAATGQLELVGIQRITV